MSGLSLNDIAKALNLAPSTISRALSRPDKVAPNTRQKILDYVNKVGFKPNITARNLRKQCTYAIGIVVNDLADRIIARAANIMQDEVAKRGFFPIVLSTEDSRSKERELISQLMQRDVSGLVVIPSSATANILKDFSHIPVVELDRSTGTHLHNEFRMDDYAAMQLATNYLYEQGSRNIVVTLGNVRRISSFYNRFLALEQCRSDLRFFPFSLTAVKADELVEGAFDLTLGLLMSQDHYQQQRLNVDQERQFKERTLDLESIMLDLNNFTPRFKVDLDTCATSSAMDSSVLPQPTPCPITSFRQFMAAPSKIDAILATNNSIATGVLQACYALGFVPQQDITLFSFDNPDWLKVLPFKIPTITNPLEQSAYLAVNRLLDLVEHKHTQSTEVRLISPELVV